jgi:hypothetical protein
MTKHDPRKVLRYVLRGISPAHDEDYRLNLNYVSAVAERLPLPYMVFLTLIMGTDCEYVRRPAEKTAWSINLRFRDVPFCLEHGKSGMRIATSAAPDSPVIEELVRVLHRAFPVADRVLQPDVDVQVRAGNVTAPNRQHLFRQRYEFFRDSARAAFEAPPRSEDIFRPQGSAREEARSVDIFKNGREGFFFGAAAIDAYFSWLEHVLVLVLPFVEYDPTKDDLVAFIGGAWTDKLKRVWDLASDKDAKSLYDALREIKERFRNSIAHGGLEKGDASLAVHIPGLGAVPTRLSHFTESIHYGVFPLKNASFGEACELFNAVDAHLRNGSTRYGMRFAESALNVAFDAKSREDYQKAMQSDDDFDGLLGRLSYFDDMHANMDW